MFKKFTRACVHLVQKYLPDPFLFAIILSIIVFLGGMFATEQSAFKMAEHWYAGFWKLLKFSMQMALVLITGNTMANAPIIKKGLDKLAFAKTPTQAIMLVTFVSLIACWLNWGFGLVVGALFAQALARKVPKLDYRLLIASAYSGFLIWHAGISGSVPLTVASASKEALTKATNGALTTNIPITETIFSSFNIVICLTLLIVMPLLNSAMHPSSDEVVAIDPKLLESEKVEKKNENPTFADKMENSPVLSMITGILGVYIILEYFKRKGFHLTLDMVNFIFLIAGIILHKTPRKFIDAFNSAVKGSAGIILQFPFYAGIMGMMTGVNAEGMSLAKLISEWFVNISTTRTFPLFTFWSAGIVNLFVPSGGGQWAVQAPVMMQAGAKIGVPAAKTAMSIAWGDAWTNMIQPFWALPALGIAGLGARDIMGYCVMNLIVGGIIISSGLIFLG